MNTKPDSSITTPNQQPTKPPSHNPWDAIEIGSTVLYRESKAKAEAEGWFECTVIAISKDGRTLSLRWRDYPAFKPFDVRRLAVGLICIVK